jgi:site-specific recombinase XerD
VRKPRLTIVPATTENRTVSPRRGRKNADMRSREYLTPEEVDQLLGATRDNRNRLRDWLMVDMCFRHGLRVSELINLRWDQIHLNQASVHIRRLKGGKDANHPIQGNTLRRLRQLRREQPHSTFVFISERKAPFSISGFAMLVSRLGEKAGLELKIHPHMLRHACGYALANRGKDTRAIQGYLGHANIRNTVKYTDLAPNRFKDIWQ